MALRSLIPSRLAAAGLVVAGALVGTAGGAAAQYYDYYDAPAPRAYGYSYGDEYDGYYGRRMAPPRVVTRIRAQDFGMVRVDRTVRTATSQVIDGIGVDGSRIRLIFDTRSGAFVDRIVLKPAPAPRERVARIDPRNDEKPVKRLVPRPPERPAALKPPAEASAPATTPIPSPAAPPRVETPKPAPAAPTEASAPATTAVPSPAAPPPVETPKPAPAAPVEASAPATTPATPPATAAPGADTSPALEIKKPRVVYPSPIQEQSAAEPAAPVAKAAEPAIPTPSVVDLPPVQTQDIAPAVPKPESPAVPVAPME